MKTGKLNIRIQPYSYLHRQRWVVLPKPCMTCFSDFTLKMFKRGRKDDILVLFELTCSMNGPLFYQKYILVEPIQQRYSDSPDSNKGYVVLEAIHCQFEGLARCYKMERENPVNVGTLTNTRKLMLIQVIVIN